MEKGISVKFFSLLLVGLISTSFVRTVEGQAGSDVCYLVADNDGTETGEDVLVAVNRTSGVESVIGPLGTLFVEAIAFSPYEPVLFAANGGALGRVDLQSGYFTTNGPIGRGNGIHGEIFFDDVDGLAFDASTAVLYGTVRADPYNLLIQLNPDTGLPVKHGFDISNDYVEIELDSLSAPGSFVDDIAIDPQSGTAYLVVNADTGSTVLHNLNLRTGATTSVATLDASNVEGLSFFPGIGLVGSIGDSGRRIVAIDVATGATQTIASLGEGNNRDYESLSCSTDANVSRPTFTPSFTFEPGDITLMQNAPNPANDYTAIPFVVSKTLTVEVAVYDMLGREVISVGGQQFGPGAHSLNISTVDIPNGVYFYRLASRVQSESLKMVVAH